MKPLDRQYVVRHIFLASFTVLCFFAFFFFLLKCFQVSVKLLPDVLSWKLQKSC